MTQAMIALTQEKREELKMFLSASIEKRCTVYTLSKQRELETLRDQIALASLMAEEVNQVIFNNHLYDGYIEWVDCNKDYFISNQSDCRRVLYTAPPVPEINTGSKLSWNDAFKLLDINACGEDRITAFMMGAEWQLSEVKRLNGWGE